MKVIAIDGVIGWDVDGRDVRRQLADANGADVKVNISSIGGSVLPGLEIFNYLRNYKGQVHTHIIGTAASMASYISLAGDTRTAEDNAVYMIHNVRGFGGGDHNELRKRADVFEGLTKLLANEYARATGLPLSEIRALMDAETFYFGNEIKDAGFVERVEKGASAIAKDDAIATAKLALEDCLAKMRADEAPQDNMQEVAAMLGDLEKVQNALSPEGGSDKQDGDTPDNINAASMGGQIKQEVAMDLKELQSKHPALYGEVMAAGRVEGVAAELDRVKGHLTMATSTGAVDMAHTNILEGKNLSDQTVIAGYMSEGLKTKDIKAKADDTPAGDLDNPENQDEEAAADDLLAGVMARSQKKGAAVNPKQEA